MHETPSPDDLHATRHLMSCARALAIRGGCTVKPRPPRGLFLLISLRQSPKSRTTIPSRWIAGRIRYAVQRAGDATWQAAL